MNLKDLIYFIGKNKILFREENGILRFHATDGVMDDTIKEIVKKYKSSLINLIHPYSTRWCMIAPASINQEALVFIQKLMPSTTAYHVAISFRLCSPINKTAFESACNSVLNKHTQLRASFRTVQHNEKEDGLLCQVISDSVETPLSFYNENYSEDTLKTLIKRDYAQKFNIEEGPLVRWAVHNSDSDSPVVLITMHHAIVDAWSIRILLKELLAFYNCNLSGSTNTLINCEPSYTYIDFSLDQHSHISDNNFNKNINSYIGMLKPCLNRISYLTGSERQINPAYKGSSIPFTINSETFRKILNNARDHGVSVSTILFSVYAYLIHRESGLSKFTIGFPFANRLNSLFTDTVGYFVNTMAIPAEIDSYCHFDEFIKLMHSILNRVSEFQHIPFPELVANINKVRNNNAQPVIQVFFNYISRALLGQASDFIYETDNNNQVRTLDGLRIKPFPIPQQEGQFDITLEIIERSNYASGQLKYSTDIFTSEEADTLLKKFLDFLDNVLTDPSLIILNNNTSDKPAAKRIAVSATFTADLISESLGFWLKRLDLKYEPVFAPTGQIMQQLLDPSSVLNTNKNGCNVLLLRVEDLADSNDSQFKETLIIRYDEIHTALTYSLSSSKSTYLIFFCPPGPDILKNQIIKEIIDETTEKYLNQFNALPGVYATTYSTMFTWYPVKIYHDQLRLDNGHIPYTDEFHTVIATSIIRRLFVTLQKPVKVISVDCDNTLWGGIAAEDGIHTIDISENYAAFQIFLAKQAESGKLLTLVSKNREDDVCAVFSENKQMQLFDSSIYSKKINWNPKSENIQQLAEEINVGLDSFLVIDDNPVECAEISGALKQVLTLQFPSCQHYIPSFINGLWMLDTPKLTNEDRKRSDYYHLEKLRNTVRSRAGSYADFIDTLEIEVRFDSFNEQNGERLSQLTFRTNQFNFSDTKLSYHEINRMHQNGHEIHSISVKDRFGDYGIVGMTSGYMDGTTFTIDLFLLSCRVLGRGVEFQVLNKLIDNARQYNAQSIFLRFKKTERNLPAFDFLKKIMKIHPPARYDNGLILNLPETIPEFKATDSALINTDKNSPIEPEIQHELSAEIQSRNIHYKDIVENLATLDKIRAAIEQNFVKISSYTPPPVSGTTDVLSTEHKIIEIWKRVLRRDTFCTTTNFFDIGGSSLQLPQILSDLEKEFNAGLMLVDLFKYTTIKTLSGFISGKISHDPTVPRSSAEETKPRRLSGMEMLRKRQQQSGSRMNL